MDTMTIAVAGAAAMAILLIAAGIATSGGGSGINVRLERYASGRVDTKPAPTRAASSTAFGPNALTTTFGGCAGTEYRRAASTV